MTHLLGFKFAPRIRDLSDSKLFTIDKASEYPKLEAILRGQINTKVIEENYEDVLRLAHSIREGTVSASRGLNKGEAMNGLARAIFFGKQGELRERTMQHQLQRASALNIIINAISIWNTLHLTKAVVYIESYRKGSFDEIYQKSEIYNRK